MGLGAGGGSGRAETLRLDTEEELGRGGGAPVSAGSVATVAKVETPVLTPRRMAMALLSYILVVVVFTIAKLNRAVKGFLVGTGKNGDFGTDLKIHWPGLDGRVLTTAGTPSTTSVFTFSWLPSPGTLLLVTALVVAAVYRVSPAPAAGEFVRTVVKLRLAILTVSSVLALAYVMNLSGQTIAIGTCLAGTGAFFAFLSPVLGWIGTAVTGSDTSANALFATLQQSAGVQAGIDPTLLVAANTTGGVGGKMISPQNLTIAATAVGLLGREADIFRAVIKWSLGLLLALCVLVYLQSTILSFMIP